jgi:hypothetical protein
MTARARPDPPPSTPPASDAEQRPGDGGGRGEAMETDPVAKVVPIDDLSVDPGNLRTHDARSDSGIEASLKRFGPARSIVVDGKGVVRAGNGTLEAARRAGITDVLVVEPKPGQLVAVRRSDWSPSEATGYAISDNRLTDLSAFDPDGLAKTLRALQDEDFDLDAVGFTDAEVDALFGTEGGEVVDDPQAEWQGMPECENGDEAPYRTLNVHFATQEAVADFEERIGQKITDLAKYIWHPELKIQRPSATPYVDES